MNYRVWGLSGCAVLAIAGFSTQAAAQEASSEVRPSAGTLAASQYEGDIIVTARRRTETAQETPVAMTVLSEAQLDRYGVRGVATIAQMTPGLLTGETASAVGGSISLRGVGSGEANAFIDQAVSINVDGVPISTAQILRAAQLDLKQIEVLRGPQALFFGKNSPGGIISLATANPGNELELMARVGYEFTANERFVELTASTPITDTLGVRLAGRYSKMDGYINVISPPYPGVIPYEHDAFPKQEELFLRGTVSFQPTDRLDISLKGTLANTDVVGGAVYFNDVVACPYGTPQENPVIASNCRNDGTIVAAQFSPEFMALNPLMGDNPHGFRDNRQTLLSSNINYELSDTLTLTSVTGHYKVREHFTGNGAYGLGGVLGFGVRFSSDQFTQELRLASSYDNPVNFVVGGFYENRNLYTATFIGFPASLGQRPVESTNQRQLAYSAFGQLLVDVTEKIQLSAGGRYSHEIKRLLDYTVTPPGGDPVDITQDPRHPGTKLTFKNFSPEVTLTYKPVQDVMLFAAYKHGFKSGGFDAAYTAGAILANPARTQTFEPEKVKGFEGGFKSSFADRQVTLNLTGYWYDYTDLQVATFDTQGQSYTTQNAARARVRGVELESRFRPNGAPGLSFHAAAAFSDATYREYLSDCYAGQSQAMGCNQVLNEATGNYTSQDVSGRRMRKAPVFTATFGNYFEQALTSDLMMSLGMDVLYSDGYVYGLNYQPLAYQRSFLKMDSMIRLFSSDRKWELAAIGRNLTDERNLVNGVDRTGTGGLKGTNMPACSTLTQTGCQKLGDIAGTPAMPRTLMLQFTYRY